MTTQTQDQAMAELDAVAALAGKSGADAIRWIQSELQRVTEWLDETEKERKRLQAILAEIEKQEPVGWLVTKPVDVDVGVTQETDLEWECWPEEYGYKNDPLYLAPPAPAVPDGWRSVEDHPLVVMLQHPSRDHVDSPVYDVLVEELVLMEVPMHKGDPFVCVARIDDDLNIVDCDGDEIGYSVHEVSRWAPLPKNFAAAPQPPAASDEKRGAWQPIETAPKDLVFIGTDGVDVGPAWWYVDQFVGWMTSNKPTHWMPLPSVPQVAIDAMREGGE